MALNPVLNDLNTVCRARGTKRTQFFLHILMSYVLNVQTNACLVWWLTSLWWRRSFEDQKMFTFILPEVYRAVFPPMIKLQDKFIGTMWYCSSVLNNISIFCKSKVPRHLIYNLNSISKLLVQQHGKSLLDWLYWN